MSLCFLLLMIFWVVTSMFLGVIYSGLREVLLFRFLSNIDSASSLYKAKKEKLDTILALIGGGAIMIISSALMLLFLFIKINYITVVAYTILVALLFSKFLYTKYEEHPKSFKNAFYNGITCMASTCWWFFLPGKVMMYVCALVLMIISQLVDLQIVTPNNFWGEFFNLHEYAILIIISVDAITEHVIPDLQRIHALINAKNQEENF